MRSEQPPSSIRSIGSESCGVAIALRDAVLLFLTLSVWLAVASVLMVGVTAMALGVPFETLGWGLYLPALVVYVVYVGDRRAVSDDDWLNHPLRSRLVTRYDAPLRATESVAVVAYEGLLLASLPLHRFDGLVALAVAHLPFVVAVVYLQLKAVPVLDSLAVAVTWSSLIVATVVAVGGAGLSVPVGVAFIAWTLVVFAGVESRNVGDAEGDEQADHGTLASRLGAARTRLFVVGAKASGAGLFWVVGGGGIVVLLGCYFAYLSAFRHLTAAAKTAAGPSLLPAPSARETYR
ncbi:UbiA family prenyltransferase [Halolamina sp. C58]|uniref:UbiA family prenyltransferase n=1 Tax=Halolamina sp. C58 TaxID=3421640 RepID=UPI003EB6AD57